MEQGADRRPLTKHHAMPRALTLPRENLPRAGAREGEPAVPLPDAKSDFRAGVMPRARAQGVRGMPRGRVVGRRSDQREVCKAGGKESEQSELDW